jgi:hypothetical protein
LFDTQFIGYSSTHETATRDPARNAQESLLGRRSPYESVQHYGRAEIANSLSLASMYSAERPSSLPAGYARAAPVEKLRLQGGDKRLGEGVVVG